MIPKFIIFLLSLEPEASKCGFARHQLTYPNQTMSKKSLDCSEKRYSLNVANVLTITLRNFNFDQII